MNATSMTRSDSSLLATANLSLALGRMSVTPELGVGIGRRRTDRVDCEPAPVQPPPNCDPQDPTCGMVPVTPVCIDAAGEVYVGDKFGAITYTPRASAAVRVAVPLFEHVWLEGVATLSVAPFGHASGFAIVSESDPNPMAPGTVNTSLPGEPMTAIQLGVGLRIGAP